MSHSSSSQPSNPTQCPTPRLPSLQTRHNVPSYPPTRLPPPSGFQRFPSRFCGSEIIVNSPRAMRGSNTHTVTPPIIFSVTLITIIIKLALYNGFVLYKFEIIISQVLLHYQHTFPPLRQTLYAGRITLLDEASELSKHVALQFVVVRKNTSSNFVLQGARRWQSEGAKSWLFFEKDRKTTSSDCVLHGAEKMRAEGC